MKAQVEYLNTQKSVDERKYVAVCVLFELTIVAGLSWFIELTELTTNFQPTVLSRRLFGWLWQNRLQTLHGHILFEILFLVANTSFVAGLQGTAGAGGFGPNEAGG